MFKKVFIEEGVKDHPLTQKILSSFKQKPFFIRKIEDVFGRVHKRSSEKNHNLFLFIGRKKGILVKKAPPAYGFKNNEKHYYFIHSYNCIYDCLYCYLQGYFSSPDIVVYINHEEIISTMTTILSKHSQERIWFHAGEFSDSFALPPQFQEWELYWKFFRKHPSAYLELRTKSNQISLLKNLEPLSNVVVSFSLNPTGIAREYERRTPSTLKRLEAMILLASKGFRLGIHLDPIIYTNDFEKQYGSLIEDLACLPQQNIEYISLGTMRFNKNFFKKNPQHLKLRNEEMVTGFDKKTRYLRPLRLYLASFVKKQFIKTGIPSEKIYYCMEEEPTD